MAINTYRWKPDTCLCVVIETHDTEANTWSGRITPTPEQVRARFESSEIPEAELSPDSAKIYRPYLVDRVMFLPSIHNKPYRIPYKAVPVRDLPADLKERLFLHIEEKVREDASGKICPKHADIPEDELYGVLHANPDGENRRKNEIHGHLLNDYDHLADTMDAETENERRVFKPGVDFAWSYEGTGKDRVLHVTVIGAALTGEHRNKFQAFTHSKHGPNKVALH